MRRYKRLDSERALAKTRIVTDLFGPLIDISKLTPFDRIEGSRHLHHDHLVKELLRQKLEVSWTAASVFERIRSCLVHWERYPGLLNEHALHALARAYLSGTEIVVATTVPDDRLFEVAKHAVTEVARSILEEARSDDSMPDPMQFRRLRKGEPASDWGELLGQLRGADERYTYVLHDSMAAQAGLTEEPEIRLCDEWWGYESDELDKTLTEALDLERRFAPLCWLVDASHVKLTEYRAFGSYLVFDDDRRHRITQQAARVAYLGQRSQRPISVVLGGPSGSGKSYFVEQFVKGFGSNLMSEATSEEASPEDTRDTPPIVEVNLAGVHDLHRAVEEHITDAISKGAVLGFIDEIDTEVDGRLVFRMLMKPMTGDWFDQHGRATGTTIPFRVWFMAGSIGSSRQEWVQRLQDKELKVIDWSNRVTEWIELPAVQSFDAILQAASIFAAPPFSFTRIEKKALAFFGLAEWRDSRHLSNIAQLIGVDNHSSGGEVVRASSVTMVCRHYDDLRPWVRTVSDLCFGESDEIELVPLARST